MKNFENQSQEFKKKLQQIYSDKEKVDNLFNEKRLELKHAKTNYNNRNNEILNLREKY